ncbi:MAG: redoxin domain-containing protein [Candidatus Thiothrix singaporensis]|uniref:Redoxin domain-containing protein n=1 Tax=Candidatus Thiothrix singaporensis TaxID=2799669 RepID=A0A7L6AWW4_9GAMM|nr:MAG: redoxin domain-containing protein [Candidatus Thiothrix singaporensis]
MKTHWPSIVIAVSLILGTTIYARSGLLPEATAAEQARPAPEFTHTDPDEWLNSKPLTLADLRGKVVLLDIWTFDCWNCYRSFPWLNGLEAQYEKQGLQVIGVHSPNSRMNKTAPN